MSPSGKMLSSKIRELRSSLNNADSDEFISQRCHKSSERLHSNPSNSKDKGFFSARELQHNQEAKQSQAIPKQTSNSVLKNAIEKKQKILSNYKERYSSVESIKKRNPSIEGSAVKRNPDQNINANKVQLEEKRYSSKSPEVCFRKYGSLSICVNNKKEKQNIQNSVQFVNPRNPSLDKSNQKKNIELSSVKTVNTNGKGKTGQQNYQQQQLKQKYHNQKATKVVRNKSLSIKDNIDILLKEKSKNKPNTPKPILDNLRFKNFSEGIKDKISHTKKKIEEGYQSKIDFPEDENLYIYRQEKPVEARQQQTTEDCRNDQYPIKQQRLKSRESINSKQKFPSMSLNKLTEHISEIKVSNDKFMEQLKKQNREKREKNHSKISFQPQDFNNEKKRLESYVLDHDKKKGLVIDDFNESEIERKTQYTPVANHQHIQFSAYQRQNPSIKKNHAQYVYNVSNSQANVAIPNPSKVKKFIPIDCETAECNQTIFEGIDNSIPQSSLIHQLNAKYQKSIIKDGQEPKQFNNNRQASASLINSRYKEQRISNENFRSIVSANFNNKTPTPNSNQGYYLTNNLSHTNLEDHDMCHLNQNINDSNTNDNLLSRTRIEQEIDTAGSVQKQQNPSIGSRVHMTNFELSGKKQLMKQNHKSNPSGAKSTNFTNNTISKSISSNIGIHHINSSSQNNCFIKSDILAVPSISINDGLLQKYSSSDTYPDTGATDKINIEDNCNDANTEQPEQKTERVRKFPEISKSKISTQKNGAAYAFAVNTHKGNGNSNNEDRVAIFFDMVKLDNSNSDNNLNIQTNLPFSFFGLYQGFNGSDCSNFMKDNQHKYIIKSSLFPKNINKAVREACIKADYEFLNKAWKKQPVDESGCTGIIFMVQNHIGYMIHVGNCKLIISRGCGSLFREIGTNFTQKSGKPPHFGDLYGKINKEGKIPKTAHPFADLQISQLDKSMDFLYIASNNFYKAMRTKSLEENLWNSIKNGQKEGLDQHNTCGKAVDRILQEVLLRDFDQSYTCMLVLLNKKSYYMSNLSITSSNDSKDNGKNQLDNESQIVEMKNHNYSTKMTNDLIKYQKIEVNNRIESNKQNHIKGNNESKGVLIKNELTNNLKYGGICNSTGVNIHQQVKKIKRGNSDKLSRYLSLNGRSCDFTKKSWHNIKNLVEEENEESEIEIEKIDTIGNEYEMNQVRVANDIKKEYLKTE